MHDAGRLGFIAFFIVLQSFADITLHTQFILDYPISSTEPAWIFMKRTFVTL